MEIDPFIFRLSIFILSIFIGYYVVWSVTPSLPDKAAIIAPTMITEEIAFVTDINGVCKEGVTLQTT